MRRQKQLTQMLEDLRKDSACNVSTKDKTIEELRDSNNEEDKKEYYKRFSELPVDLKCKEFLEFSKTHPIECHQTIETVKDFLRDKLVNANLATTFQNNR